MKRFFLPLSILFLLLFNGSFLNAQVLVNKAWQDTTGNPQDTLTLQFALKDGSSNYVTVGNTYATSDSEQILITKYTNAGSKVWQIKIASPSTKKTTVTDFNIRGGYIYIAASPYDSVNSKSTFVTDKISDSTGAIIWAKQYTPSYTGYAVPAAIREDSLGNVYVAGTEQTATSEYEMTILKYNSSGTLLWTSHYDSTGLYSGAVGMSSMAKDSSFFVTGYSGSTFGTWDIVTTKWNAYTGARLSVSRVSNGSGSFISHPVALAKDGQDAVYVVGASEISGPNVDIKVIKYDSLFNQVWVKKWGASDSLDDEPAYMVMDNSKNLIITGYTTHTNGTVDLLVVKYDKNGTVLWSRTANNGGMGTTHIAKGASVAVDDSSNIYVTGKIYNGFNYDIVTAAYDLNGNILWQKIYDAGGGSNDVGMNVSLDDAKNVYVSGTSGSTTTKFITMQYVHLKITDTIANDTVTHTLYAKGNLIMRFNSSVLNSTLINDDGKIFGTPDQVLTSSFATTFKNKLTSAGIDPKTCYLQKLAPSFHTNNKTLISKIGDTIKIPQFWASFLLIYPSGAAGEKLVRDSLRRLYPSIQYVHLNYAGWPTCSCTTVCADDPSYSTQYGLFNDSTGTYAHGGVNAEGAWTLETGKPFIKVGIFDTGIEWQHEDFMENSSTSKIVGGKDYAYNPGVFLHSETNGGDFYGHGTAAAGIIGALRNNNVGVAGIAGGNYCNSPTPDNVGASLYSYEISVSSGPTVAPLSSAIITAMTDAFSTDSTKDYTNMDILNFSDAITVPDRDSFQEFKEKYYYAFRLGKITVASRGNSQLNLTTTDLCYPACFNDDWILCVGGSDYHGGLATYQNSSSQGSLWGFPLDLMAPYYGIMNQTTTIPFNSYEAFSGTSAAAPYASGLAALLLSHSNNPTGVPDAKNLAPEDVEQIMQRTAYFNPNLASAPYSDSVGWGRINMGAAMMMTDTTHARLLHFNSLATSSTPTTTKISGSDISVKILDNVPGDSLLMSAGLYKAEVWKYSVVVHHNVTLRHGETLLGAWTRSSSSNSYPIYDSIGGTYQLEPYEKTYIDSTVMPDSSKITVFGYFYKLKDSLSNVIGWVPQNPNDSTARPKLSYTLYLDTFHYTQPLDVSEIKKGFSISAYPNPASDRLHLNLDADKEDFYTITLYDVLGQPVKTLFTGKTAFLSTDYNISNLGSGNYFLRVSSTNEQQVITFSVLK